MRPLFHTLLLALSIALVALSGCKKTDALASINGTWTSDSYHERTIAGNTLILDTTYSVTPYTMTFAGDSISTSLGIKGLYTLNGNTLLITYEADSNGPYTPYQVKYTIQTLNAHSLDFMNGLDPGTQTTYIYTR